MIRTGGPSASREATRGRVSSGRESDTEPAVGVRLTKLLRMRPVNASETASRSSTEGLLVFLAAPPASLPVTDGASDETSPLKSLVLKVMPKPARAVHLFTGFNSPKFAGTTLPFP